MSVEGRVPASFDPHRFPKNLQSPMRGAAASQTAERLKRRVVADATRHERRSWPPNRMPSTVPCLGCPSRQTVDP